MKGLTLMLLSVVVASPAWAESLPHEQRRLADELFSRGVAERDRSSRARQLFREAAQAYQDVRRRAGSDSTSSENRFEDPTLYLMEGNAWLLGNDVPQAIVAYRRGLRVSPNDRDLWRSLVLARSRVEFTSEDRSLLTQPADRWRWFRDALRQWGGIVVLVANALGWLMGGCWVITRRGRWLAISIGLILVASLTTVAWGTDRVIQVENDAIPIGVMKDPWHLRCGNGVNFLPRRQDRLPAGTEVRVIARRGEWYQVELADQTVGWLPSTVLIIDAPLYKGFRNATP